MAVLRLSFMARMQIMAILNEKSTGKGGDRDFGIGADLYEKIEVPEEEQLHMLDPGVTLDERLKAQRRVKEYPVLEVELNYKELEKLDKILTEFEKIRPMDRRMWYRDVMAQLADRKSTRLNSSHRL